MLEVHRDTGMDLGIGESQAEGTVGALTSPRLPLHFRAAHGWPSESAYELAVGGAEDVTGKVL